MRRHWHGALDKPSLSFVIIEIKVTVSVSLLTRNSIIYCKFLHNDCPHLLLCMFEDLKVSFQNIKSTKTKGKSIRTGQLDLHRLSFNNFLLKLYHISVYFFFILLLILNLFFIQKSI